MIIYNIFFIGVFISALEPSTCGQSEAWPVRVFAATTQDGLAGQCQSWRQPVNSAMFVYRWPEHIVLELYSSVFTRSKSCVVHQMTVKATKIVYGVKLAASAENSCRSALRYVNNPIRLYPFDLAFTLGGRMFTFLSWRISFLHQQCEVANLRSWRWINSLNLRKIGSVVEKAVLWDKYTVPFRSRLTDLGKFERCNLPSVVFHLEWQAERGITHYSHYSYSDFRIAEYLCSNCSSLSPPPPLWLDGLLEFVRLNKSFLKQSWLVQCTIPPML